MILKMVDCDYSMHPPRLLATLQTIRGEFFDADTTFESVNACGKWRVYDFARDAASKDTTLDGYERALVILVEEGNCDRLTTATILTPVPTNRVESLT